MPSIGELLPLLATVAEGPVGELVGEAVADGVSGAVANGASKVAGAVIDPIANTVAGAINPQLSAMLDRNDLSQYPNIQRAQQDPDGLSMLHQFAHHMFGSLNGQPLHPEYNAPVAPAQKPTTYDPDQQDSTPE